MMKPETMRKFARDYPYTSIFVKHFVLFFAGTIGIVMMGFFLFLVPYIFFAALVILIVRSFIKDWKLVQTRGRRNDGVIDIDVD